MALTNETITGIREQLKKEFPGWKFSVTTKGARSITVALMSGPRDVFVKNSDSTAYCQVNHHYISHYSQQYANEWPQLSHPTIITDEAVEMIGRITEFSNKTNWNRSDIMTDYFDVGFYFYFHIGKWDKPFAVK